MAIGYKRTQPQAQPFAMAPMVDMVFLLLVFFMCVTAVSGGRARLKLDLPQMAAAAVGDGVEAGPQVVLGLGADGALELNGVPCLRAELLPQLRRMRAQGASAVRVRADANTPYRDIAPVLAACRAAGFATVSYAAYEIAPTLAANATTAVPAAANAMGAVAAIPGDVAATAIATVGDALNLTASASRLRFTLQGERGIR